MLISYATLFVLVLVAARVFVPAGYLQSTLKHPVGPGSYLILARLTASLALVASARVEVCVAGPGSRPAVALTA